MKNRGKGLLAICLCIILSMLPSLSAEAIWEMGGTVSDYTLSGTDYDSNFYVGSGGYTINGNPTVTIANDFNKWFFVKTGTVTVNNQGTLGDTLYVDSTASNVTVKNTGTINRLMVSGSNTSIDSTTSISRLYLYGGSIVGPKVNITYFFYSDGSIADDVVVVSGDLTIIVGANVSALNNKIELQSTNTTITNENDTPVEVYVKYNGSSVKVTVPGNTTKALADFTVTASLTMDNYREDTNPVPSPKLSLTPSTAAVSEVAYDYKKKGADDSTYTTEQPKTPGTYTVRAKFKDTLYNSLHEATADFTVYPKPAPTGSVSMANYYYGASPSSPVASSSNNITEGITFLYKTKGAGDDTYTSAKPSAVGEYTVKATFPASGSDPSFSATADFSITYLPAPEIPFVPGGVVGTNGFFTSDLTLSAPEGYEISETMAGPYVSFLSLTESTAAGQIYLRQKNTGAITAAIARPAVMIDKDFPVFDTEDGNYYSDKLMISAGDPNLSKITVNGVPLTGQGALQYATLTADTEEVVYTIIATDLAGNETKRVITLYPAFEKTGTLKPGNLKCREGKKYTLPEGDWNLSGDAGSYAGGMDIYFPSTGYYDFSQN